ncbi:MAG: Uma2 family endonuclease [Pseudomonadota bacterium]|nr:Uma2 family endonuclease [Pseudomonadota bacterium]
MSIHRHSFETSEAFLRWNEGREGKRELVDGEVIEMMINVSRAHVKLATALTVALCRHLDTSDFDIGSADFGIATPAGIRYPDVFVDRAGGTPRDLAAHAPILVAEILSPSSLAIDFGEKADEYTAIDSLAHYLVLSQEEPRVWVWSRGADGSFERPVMIAGREETLHLAALEIDLPLADLYRGIA